jgi:hypothetical protein
MKTSPARVPRYLAFVRTQPCWFCSSTEGIHAHHHGRTGGGMGIKGCDLHAVPLCSAHHREWHQKGRVDPFDKRSTILELWRASAECLRRYILGELENP